VGRQSLRRARVGFGDGPIQRAQELQIVFIIITEVVGIALASHERTPGSDGQATEFVWCEFIECGFDFCEAHNVITIPGKNESGNRLEEAMEPGLNSSVPAEVGAD
jgi:hypothetical protein